MTKLKKLIKFMDNIAVKRGIPVDVAQAVSQLHELIYNEAVRLDKERAKRSG